MAERKRDRLICPTCKYEYPEGIDSCPDCGTALLKRSVSKGGAQSLDNSWVSICSITGKAQKRIARDALDSNNIPSVITNPDLGQSVSAVGDEMLELEIQLTDVLMVPREFRVEAYLILRTVLGDESLSEELQ